MAAAVSPQSARLAKASPVIEDGAPAIPVKPGEASLPRLIYIPKECNLPQLTGWTIGLWDGEAWVDLDGAGFRVVHPTYWAPLPDAPA